MLNPRKKYLQVAFNRTLEEVKSMISMLPASENILIEAGTPFIKRYGVRGIREIDGHWQSILGKKGYIVADLKCMDRGSREVSEMALAGASAATCLGLAPIDTINEFIKTCREMNVDSMVDMMNVEFPFEILQQLKKLPQIVVLHRGADENEMNREKQLPHRDIRKIKSAYSGMLISIAGGESPRDVQRTFFNDADISVVWRAFYDNPTETNALIKDYIDKI